MFACSITVYSHDAVAQNLLKKLGAQGVAVINSAVFNAGFLIGGGYVKSKLGSYFIELNWEIYDAVVRSSAISRLTLYPLVVCVHTPANICLNL